MRSLLFDAPGEPTYVTLWLVLTPLMVIVLRAFRVGWPAIGIIVLTTFSPPRALPDVVSSILFIGTMSTLVWWLVRQMRRDKDGASGSPSNLPVKMIALIVLTLVLRIPLSWHSPHMYDISIASQTAADQLLSGNNPYSVPNEDTLVGRYQYPAGSLLLHVPLVAALPDEVGAAKNFPGRVLLWLVDAAAAALLVLIGSRFSSGAGSLIPALVYALHPIAVRDTTMVVANDMIVSLFLGFAVIALARRKRVSAGLLIGLAISVKPVALVALPVIGLAAGVGAVGTALTVALGLQVPFLLWPRVGAHGLGPLIEPAARAVEGTSVVSGWMPLYQVVGVGPEIQRFAALAGFVGALAIAGWCGTKIRKLRTEWVVAAAISLPLLVLYTLASSHHINYHDWFLIPFVIAWAGAVLGQHEGRASPYQAPVRP